jgi:cation transport regulator
MNQAKRTNAVRLDSLVEETMPYKKLTALPESVRNNLPRHAQEIYLAAFNNAWEEYREPEDRHGKASREEVAHKVA